MDNPKKEPIRIFLHGEIAIGILKDCRTAKACSFKGRLGFNLHVVFNKKQQAAVEILREVFEAENMQDGYYALGYRNDLYFHDYRLAIEVDEFGRCDRNIECEKERERILKEEFNCLFIRINPDEGPDFNTNAAINKLIRPIKK